MARPRAFRRLVADEIRQGALVTEYTSPLGSRRHRAAVKRRMSAGEHGASVVGNEFLLSGEALAEEMRSLALAKRSKNAQLDAIQRERVGGLRSLGEVR